MYCTYCGGELREGSEFCTKCGQRLGDGSFPYEAAARAGNEAANGSSQGAGAATMYAEPPVLQIKCVSCDKAISDEAHPVNNCPYCGTSQLPSVYPNTGYISAHEERRAAREQRRAELKGHGRLIKAAAVAALAIGLTFIIKSAVTDIADSFTPHKEEIIWPSTGLAQMLPEVDRSYYGYIYTDSNDAFAANVYGFSVTDFSDYIDICRELGYNVDAEKYSNSFEAYNEDGYKLELYYYNASGNEMNISLTAPMEMRPLKLADKGLAAKLPPLPEGSVGHIETDSADYISFYVGETDPEAFDEYVTACISGGFDVDYSRSNDFFYGENDDGCYISVNYLGNSIMQVNISE